MLGNSHFHIYKLQGQKHEIKTPNFLRFSKMSRTRSYYFCLLIPDSLTVFAKFDGFCDFVVGIFNFFHSCSHILFFCT